MGGKRSVGPVDDRRLTAFGPGKVILLGEHGVVYGYPALAAPISRGVTAVGEPGTACRLVLPTALPKKHADVLRRAFARAAAKAGSPRVTVHVDSEIPLSMGLGSSGALSVAVARLLLTAKAHGATPDTKHVEALAMEMEREFHGTPSGLDHTTSARGQLLVFKRGAVRPVTATKPLKVLVALAGERSGTKAIVGALRERQARWPKRYARVFQEIGRLVPEGVKAAAQGDLEGLGDVMNVNQGLLSALQVSSPRIEALVFKLRALGALGAKLTGAGGDGGAVIGLFREPEPAVVHLRSEGVTCFASQLAGPRAL